MAAQRRKKIWNTRRLPQQSDEPGLQQWWKWHKKEFLKNKINTRIQKNLMCWKKKKKGEKTSHQGAPFNWRSYSEALATMRLWKGVEKHKYIRVANPAGNTQRCKSQTHGDGREPWKKRAICRCVSVGDFAGVENQISYRLHLGRERIYTRRKEEKREIKQNEILTSWTNFYTPFLCCYVFCDGGGTAWSRSQWQKHFGYQAMTFLPFFATSFLRPGRYIQNSRGSSFYVTTQQTTMAAQKCA